MISTFDPIRTLIAAPRSAMRNRLRAWLRQEADFHVVREVPNGPLAVRWIERMSPDLVVLHVQLPGLGAFGVLNSLDPSRLPPAVILLADGPADAVRAFHARAADYLQVPFDQPRLRLSLDRVRRQVFSRVPRRPRPTLDASSLSHSDSMALRVGRGWVVVRFSDLRWVCAAQRRTKLYLTHGTLLVETAFGTVEQRLPKPTFVQINRSVMVRRDFIREIRRKSHGDQWVVLEDDQRHVLSRQRRQNVLRLLGWMA
ncbi:MAG: response regulator transcription factor [Verrucomicrobiales bacterium]|nr:response regulator transcription factor [Verrucomicrobiales bacterium]